MVLSHRAKSFGRGTLMCFRKLRYQKVLRGKKEREFRDFPTKLFCLIAEKLLSGTVYCVTVSKNYFLNRVNSRVFVENFLSHSAVIFQSGTVLCFGKFRVSKMFRDKKGEADSRVSVKISLYHCQKIS